MASKAGKQLREKGNMGCVSRMVKEFPSHDECMASMKGLEELCGGRESIETMSDVLKSVRILHEYMDSGEQQQGSQLVTSLHASMLKVLELCGSTWKEIHQGHWRGVSNSWRELFAICCMLNAILSLFKDSENFPALDMKACECVWWEEEMESVPAELVAARWIDLALLFGGERNRGQAHRMLDAIVEAVRDARRLEETRRGTKKIRVEERGDSVSSSLPSITSCKGERIPVVSSPPLLTFKLEYLDKQLPVVMTGVVDQWPAYEKWKNLEYLNELAGFRTVPIELGRNYLESGWTQRLMTLESFFDDIIRSKGDVIGYLAQHDLFEQIKELRDDFLVPDYTALTGDEEDDTLVMNAWLGPGGTVTPLHYDNYNNIFAQVVGSKYIRLYHPREQEAMYPHGGTEYNTSRVDVEEVDKEKFPLFQKASFTDCVLEAGQCLFIPKGYWHYVRSCETSFSISFWWK